MTYVNTQITVDLYAYGDRMFEDCEAIATIQIPKKQHAELILDALEFSDNIDPSTWKVSNLELAEPTKHYFEQSYINQDAVLANVRENLNNPHELLELVSEALYGTAVA